MCSTENAATTKQQTPTSTINKKKKLLYRYLCAVKTWPNEIRAVRYLTFTVAFFLRYRTTSVRYHKYRYGLFDIEHFQNRIESPCNAGYIVNFTMGRCANVGFQYWNKNIRQYNFSIARTLASKAWPTVGYWHTTLDQYYASGKFLYG